VATGEIARVAFARQNGAVSLRFTRGAILALSRDS
jgi:hypothetical protein